MGQNEKCSWDNSKQERNIANHGYDFADLIEVFDGRFAFVREDTRFDYGELRYKYAGGIPRKDHQHDVQPTARKSALDFGTTS